MRVVELHTSTMALYGSETTPVVDKFNGDNFSLFKFKMQMIRDEKDLWNIVDGAEQYTYDKNWQGNVRYDIVAIRKIQGQLEIKHIEDAFY